MSEEREQPKLIGRNPKAQAKGLEYGVTYGDVPHAVRACPYVAWRSVQSWIFGFREGAKIHEQETLWW